MNCSVCEFLTDALRDIEHAENYPYPRTSAHRRGIEQLAISHYNKFHPNPFEYVMYENEFMIP